MGQNLGKPNLIKIPATPYKIRLYRQHRFIVLSIFPSFNLFFTLFMQNKFLLVANYIFCSPPLHINKKTLKPILFILTHFHQKINYFIPLKKSCCPHILLFLFHYPSPYFYPSNTQNPSFYKALKEKEPKKEQKEKRTSAY